MRNLRFIAIVAAFLLLSVLSGTTAIQAFQTEGRGAEHNRKGIQHYNEAFYKELPQGRYKEAERLFDIAATEFQNAITADPNDAEAHKNLARLYYVRKQFLKAAGAYETLTVLEPHNIDAYVQLALCYTRLDKFDEAIQELEIAKTKTDNPEVIGKLDEYIQKIIDHRQD